jgi:transcriptional regulator with XRE-family HTH domain
MSRIRGKLPEGINPEVKVQKAGKAILSLADQTLIRRKTLRLSQHQVSEKAGLGRDAVHRIEKAQANPTLTDVEAVAKALDSKLTINLIPK